MESQNILLGERISISPKEQEPNEIEGSPVEKVDKVIQLGLSTVNKAKLDKPFQEIKESFLQKIRNSPLKGDLNDNDY